MLRTMEARLPHTSTLCGVLGERKILTGLLRYLVSNAPHDSDAWFRKFHSPRPRARLHCCMTSYGQETLTDPTVYAPQQQVLKAYEILQALIHGELHATEVGCPRNNSRTILGPSQIFGNSKFNCYDDKDPLPGRGRTTMTKRSQHL